MIKYRTRFEKIEEIEIERETDKQLVFKNGRKEYKFSSWSNYHDTWDDAHKFLIEIEEKRVDSLRLQLERAKGKLGQIKGMTANA